MKFTDLFIRRPVLALVVSLLILLIGLKCMLGLQIRQYPRLYNTTITVTTVYPGASPDLIQGFITTPIEQAVATAEGIDYLTSNSIQGTSTVTAYIRLNYDPSQARAAERGDLGLSDPSGAASLIDRRRRRLGRYSRRPDLCHAAVARPGANGGARHLSLGRFHGDPRQQLPVRAWPGERLLHRHQHRRRHRPRRCRPVQAHGREIRRRCAGADGGHRAGRSRRAELDLERHRPRSTR